MTSSFSEDTSISLPGVHYSSVAWSDYDGDGKPDFLLTGLDYSLVTGLSNSLLTGLSNSASGPISKLYKNTGSGFSEDTSISLPGVYQGSVAWSDYTGDGKPDFLLTGSGISKLYKNTGSGFTKDTSISLPGVSSSSVAWSDYNGDGKPDFLLTGWDNSGRISKLYKNTGSGFSEDTSISLPGVSSSSVAWSDYNGDGKPDFLLTGWDNSGSYISKLYKNTGSGFTKDTSISLPGVYQGSVAWSDYNGDGKPDFLLTGWDNSGRISKLYKNTGSGFSEDISISLPGVKVSSVAWSDYTGDGKPDFLLTGWDNSANPISKLYKNTTTSLDTTPPVASSFTPSDNATNIAVAADLVVNFSEDIKKGSGNIVIRKVSDNSEVETNITVSGSQLTINPTNNLASTTDYYVEIADGAIQDIAGNNYAGISGNSIWNFQTADTTAPTASSFTPTDDATNIAVGADLVVNFSEAIKKGTVGDIVIKKVFNNSVSVVETIPVTATNIAVSGSQLTINPTTDLAPGTDYYVEIADGAIQDIAGNNYAGISGNSSWNFTTTGSSSGSFTEDTSISLPGVFLSSVAWSDYNADGKPDFLLTGVDLNSYKTISKLYKNTGSGFSEDTSISLPGINVGSVAWSDYTGDGKPDFLLTGADNSGNPISKLYKNTGSGFSEDTSISLPGVSSGSVAWSDYTGDGKPDFLLTGNTSSGRISKLYKNTGSGFSEDTSISLPGVHYSSVAWSDYDGDGKPDFLLTGLDNSYNSISKLYKNTGNGFSEDTSISLPGVNYSSVAWSDYTGDGKPDFLLTGNTSSDAKSSISKLYKNTGSGFSEDTSISLPGVHNSSVAWSDYDRDGKPDLLLTGWDGGSGIISKLYKNTGSGFSEDTSISLPGVYVSSVAWSDYTGDSKPDFLLTGRGNSGGIISTLYKNTTTSLDTTPPVASSFNPADDAAWITGVAVGANLVVNFSEAIKKGSGNIVIKKVTGDWEVEKIQVTASNITVSGSQLTINPTDDLAPGTDYYVEIANGAIKDIAGNNYAGISGNSTWNFRTDIITGTPAHTPAPPASSFIPTDNATNIAVGADLVVNFSEDIKKGTVGDIVIKKVSDDLVVETIAVTTDNITVSGSQLTINPTADLAQNTDYYVEIADGAIQDITGNNYAGITGNSTWNFQTQGTNPINGTTGANNLTGTANADVINGLAGNDTLSGLAGNDILDGGNGSDRLDGGLGADQLKGGTGNDTYIVDDTGDVVTELLDQGTDLVESSVTYTLPDNVEKLTLTGITAIDGTGNNLANTINGNSANNILNGGTRADKLKGGTGDDTYIVDDTGDVVTELVDQGTDLAESSLTYILPANVEKLTLTGTTAINGTGNKLTNTINGNSANNTLNGGKGNDLLIGNEGDDQLNGGAANDTLTGGLGADNFVYDTNGAFAKSTVGLDTITDFTIGQGDQIVLDKTTFTRISSVAGTGFSVVGEFAEVTTDALAATSAANIVYNSTTGGLLYNQNGTAAGFGGSGGQFLTLTNKPALTANQFLIQA